MWELVVRHAPRFLGVSGGRRERGRGLHWNPARIRRTLRPMQCEMPSHTFSRNWMTAKFGKHGRAASSVAALTKGRFRPPGAAVFRSER